jgi:hypothetical protein
MQLGQGDELVLVVDNDGELYHSNIDLRNHFLHGKDGDPDITVTRATPPLESSASRLKPGLLQRLVWMAHRLHELKAPENVLKALGIFDPDPATVELHPSDLSDGQYAKFYIPLLDPVRQVLIQCDYNDGQG